MSDLARANIVECMMLTYDYILKCVITLQKVIKIVMILLVCFRLTHNLSTTTHNPSTKIIIKLSCRREITWAEDS